MKKKVVTFLKHPLISGSTIIFISSLIANLFNYLFNLVMGRFLVVSDYGIYSTLISFAGLFGIFPSTFITIFAKFAAVYSAKNEKNALNSLYISGLRVVLFFALFVFITLSVMTFYLSSFLQIQDTRLLLLIFMTVFISILSSLPTGILQGEMKLYLLSLLTISSPLLKIIIGFALLFWGLKVLGVSIAIFLSSLIPFVLIIAWFWKKHRKTKALEIDHSVFFREFKLYSLQFFLATLGITILSSADIILVKHFFNAEMAGQYAALSLMGKAIFYFTSPIYFVFFPLIAQKKAKKESLYGTLALAGGIILLFSVALSFFYFLFPNIILQVFFPAKEYKMLISYLGPFSLYIIVFSMATLFNSFLLSIGRTGVYKINLTFAFLFILLFYLFHDSFYQIIGALFSVSFLLLALQMLYYIIQNNDGNK